MRVRIMWLALVLAIASAFVALPMASFAAPAQAKTSALSTPITGTTSNGGTFSGTFTVQRFIQQHGGLAAVGRLTGTLTDASGNVVGTVSRNVIMPVTASVQGTTAQGTTAQALAPQATCGILHLTLGPLDLNLLGLQVHLNQVVLNIDAQSGAGNLLGNLLCAVAGLLDNGGPLNQIVGLLNQILGAL